jgi:hypothetical protein
MDFESRVWDCQGGHSEEVRGLDRGTGTLVLKQLVSEATFFEVVDATLGGE